MVSARDALTAVGMLPDVEIDPAPAALQLARLDDDGADWQAASAHLTLLARDAAAIGRILSGRSLEARIGALAGLIHAQHGYAGDVEHYDDLDNANLIRVIERRRGLPVALGVIWLHCIRAAGWTGHGVDFPGHFLLTLVHPAEPAGTAGSIVRTRQPRRLLVDPFGNGATVGSAELLSMLNRMGDPDPMLRPGVTRPMSTRDVLLRLQRNLVQRRVLAGELAPALQALEGMLMMAPGVMSSWLEAAELNHGLGRQRTAVQCLEHVVSSAPGSDAARIALERLDRWAS